MEYFYNIGEKNMAFRYDDLKDKVVVITGAARGLGKEMGLAFAEQGAKVALTDMNEANLKATSEEFTKKGYENSIHVCNVTDFDNVTATMKSIAEQWGKIDVLINNAGITKDTLFIRMKPEQFRQVIDVNLTGTFNCASAATNIMRKARSGVIINIASTAVCGNVGQANYSASKAGVVSFTRTLGREIAPLGIKTNAIAPGFIETEMTDAVPDEISQNIINHIAVKRKGQPREIANVALFLASEASSFIYGQVIYVDGSMLAMP